MLGEVYEMVEFAEFYETLKQERARLNDELKQIGARAQPTGERREGSPFGKREEEATEAFELERGLALEKQLLDALAEVEHALEKYEAGTYGVCDVCGQPIEPARLEALPQATLCLDCKAHKAKNARANLH